jgi:hypothetical protein
MNGTWTARLLGASLLMATLWASAPANAAWNNEQLLSGASNNAWEPFVAADPSSNYVYAVWFLPSGPSQCQGCPTSGLSFSRSSDSGVTWTAPVYCPYCPANSKGQYDPTIKVVSNPPVGTVANVYVTWMDWNSIMFSKSADHGATWTPQIKVSGNQWADHPWFGMSANGQDVYIFWAKGDIYGVASHNYGVTFTAPTKVNSDKNRQYYAEGVEVLSDGTVLLSAAGYPCSKGTSQCTGDIKITTFRSVNGGSSYTQTTVDTLYTGPQWMTTGLETIASDAAGTLVLMYTGAPSLGAFNQVFVRRSTNKGVTWSAATPLLDAGVSADACYPAIVGGSAGSFRASFFDNRTGEFNVWYRQSTDGGVTWSATERLSNLASGAPYKNANGFGAPYGDYSGISILSTGKTIAIFGESGPAQAAPGGIWINRQL